MQRTHRPSVKTASKSSRKRNTTRKPNRKPTPTEKRVTFATAQNPDHEVPLYQKTFWQQLSDYGFHFDLKTNLMYGTPYKPLLYTKPSEMGTLLVIGLETSERPPRYFIEVLGGASALDAESNAAAFRRIGQKGSRFYTQDEILELVKKAINQKDDSILAAMGSAPFPEFDTLTTIERFADNGQRTYACDYSNFVKHGYEREWDENGKLLTTKQWNQGKLMEN